jgi:hypothetical protein
MGPNLDLLRIDARRERAPGRDICYAERALIEHAPAIEAGQEGAICGVDQPTITG